MNRSAVGYIHALFNSAAARRWLLRLRKPLGGLLALAALLWVEPSWFWPALAVSAVGEALQLWCFGALKTGQILATRGPYAVVRNPMYLGRFLLVLGFVLLLGRVWLVLVYAAAYYFYMVNRVRREERKLRATFGEAYEAYCRRVNRFVPARRAVEWPALRYFRSAFFLRNHGHWNLLAVAAFYALAYLFAFVWRPPA